MHRRIGLALSLSALLIGGATVYRFAHAGNFASSLSVVNTPNNQEGDVTVVDTPTNVDTTDAASTSTENLNTTDLVSRQLMMDFLNLTAKGQATDANVSALADSYATSLSDLNSFKPFETADIHTIPTSLDTLTTYGNALTAFYNKYSALASAIGAKAGDLSDAKSKNFTSAMNSFGELYASAAQDLESMQVPDSLADLHLKLVNNYLSSASAFSAVGKVQSDSVTAYAALNTQSENSADEKETLLAVQGRLLAKGILFNAGI